MSHLAKLCSELSEKLVEATIRCDAMTAKANGLMDVVTDHEQRRLETEAENAGLSERLERLACENAELRSKLRAAEDLAGFHEREIERLQQQIVEARGPSFLRRCR